MIANRVRVRKPDLAATAAYALVTSTKARKHAYQYRVLHAEGTELAIDKGPTVRQVIADLVKREVARAIEGRSQVDAMGTQADAKTHPLIQAIGNPPEASDKLRDLLRTSVEI